MLLHHGEQLERHAAGALGSCFPLLHRRLAGVEVAGKDGLTNVKGLAKFFDLLRLDLGGLRQAVLIKAAHSGFADCSDLEQSAGRCVDGFKGIGFEFGLSGGFSGHGISPENSGRHTIVR